jgi:hypothetical protein
MIAFQAINYFSLKNSLFITRAKPLSPLLLREAADKNK